MASRLGRAVVWAAAGFLLGFAALAGGQGDDDLREKLIEIERLSAKLRALDGERAGLPAPNEQGFEFDFVPIADLLAGVPDFYRPHQPRQLKRDEPVIHADAEEAPQPYGTIEEIIEMIRTHVRPAAWEGGSQMGARSAALFLFAKPDVNRAVREFIDKELRPLARVTVSLEIEVVEAGEPFAAALAATAGGEIDAALRTKLDEAIAAGNARRLFGGSVRALARQQVVLWHGAQEALVSDADVDKDGRVDPVVDVEILGTIVEARSTVTGDRIRVQVTLDQDVADRPVRTTKSEKAGVLQMPARETARMATDLWLKGDRWAVGGGSSGADGKQRFLLVRPTVIRGPR